MINQSIDQSIDQSIFIHSNSHSNSHSISVITARTQASKQAMLRYATYIYILDQHPAFSNHLTETKDRAQMIYIDAEC